MNRPDAIRALRSLTFVCLIAPSLSACAEPVQAQKDPRPRNIGRATKQLLKPLENQSAANAGVFVGVNEFAENSGLSPLHYAVHDAVELAHLFVFELKLIPPENCTLLISGEPRSRSVRDHLHRLVAAGVRQRQARKIEVLTAFGGASAIARKNSDMLICSVSTHGFDEDRLAYFMPHGGSRRFVKQTAVSLNDIELLMEESEAGHRLLLIDACQERIAAKSDTPGMTTSDVFHEYLANETGQARLASCSPGQFSYESDELGGVGHGVFSYAVLESLRGNADANSDDLILLNAVVTSVKKSVQDWCRRADRKLQSPSYRGPIAAGEMPLAIKAGDRETLVVNVRQQPETVGFTTELKEALVLRLGQTDLQNEDDREFSAYVQQYLNGDMPEKVFLPYLRQNLVRHQLLPLPSDAFNSEKLRQTASTERLAKNTAFVVGVGRFDRNLAALPKTQLDVAAMRLVLKNRCGFSIRPENLTAEPDAGELTRHFRRWINSSDSAAENVVFYFRGRIVVNDEGEVVLPAYDFMPQRPGSGSLSLKKVLADLRGLDEAKHVLVLLDVQSDQNSDAIQGALQKAVPGTLNGPAVSLVAGCRFQRGWRVKTSNGSALTAGMVEHLRAIPWAPNANNGLRVSVDLDAMADAMRMLENDCLVVNRHSAESTVTGPAARPRRLDELVDDLADSIADQLIRNSVQVAVVPDFGVFTDVADVGLPGRECGPLIRYCMLRFKQRLCERAPDSLRVANDTWVHESLTAHGIGPESLCRENVKQVLNSMRNRVNRRSIALVAGELSYSGDDRIDIRCVPLTGKREISFQTVAGTATLYPSEWAMSGQSGVNAEFVRLARNSPAVDSVADQVAALRKPDAHYAPDLIANAARILTLENSGHPLVDPNFPYRISLIVNKETKPRKPQILTGGRDAFIPLKKGDTYAIHIENRSGRPVFMRLLVDGLNTLPDYGRLETDPENAAFVRSVIHKAGRLLPTQHVTLDSARSWFCEAGPGGAPRIFGVRGFFTNIEDGESGSANAELGGFEVTDASNAEAWKRGFPQQIGMITAAFYRPVRKTLLSQSPGDGYGTKLGVRTTERVSIYNGNDAPGELIAVVTLRYGVMPGGENGVTAVPAGCFGPFQN